MKINEYFGKLSEAAKVAAQWDMNETHKDTCWQKMVEDAAAMSFKTGEEYIVYRNRVDTEILNIKEQAGEKVRDKKGNYQFSKVTKSSTYRANKSMISRAIDNGIPLSEIDPTTSEQTIVPRSKLGKRVRDAVSVPLTAYIRSQKAVQTLEKQWELLSSEERKSIAKAIAESALGSSIDSEYVPF
jgi:glutamate formiminotransferase